jgi:hypothetical protein
MLCNFAEFQVSFFVMLNISVTMLNVFMLSVVVLSVMAPKDTMLTNTLAMNLFSSRKQYCIFGQV